MSTHDQLVDATRQLQKAFQTLAAVDRHLRAHAEANAALHMAGTVMYSPLSSAVSLTLKDIEAWLVTQAPDDAGTPEEAIG